MPAVQLKNVVFGAGRVKVIVPITGASADELIAQASALADHELDVVEWRIDHFAQAQDGAAVEAVGEQIVGALAGRPLLVTFRTAAEGGAQSITSAEFSALMIRLIRSGIADAVDVELRFDALAGDEVVQSAKQHGVAVVMSFHDFGATPPAATLVETMVSMQQRGADIAKIAVMPHDPGDVVELLSATWTMTSEHPATPVITMSMSGLGLVSRIGAQVMGSCATFASVGAGSAPGQVPVDQLQPILTLLDQAL